MVLSVVWFPSHNHSEIGIQDSLRYYIGDLEKNSYQHFISHSIQRADSTPLVVFQLNSEKNEQEIEEKIKNAPPSIYNTCMGSTAHIVNQSSLVKIPFLISQSPSFSALYLLSRECISKDVNVAYHGITKKSAIIKAAVHAIVEATALAAIAQAIKKIFESFIF